MASGCPPDILAFDKQSVFPGDFPNGQVVSFAYVEKAGDPEELIRHVHRAVHTHLRLYADRLEQAVEERTSRLKEANETLLDYQGRLRALWECWDCVVIVHVFIRGDLANGRLVILVASCTVTFRVIWQKF